MQNPTIYLLCDNGVYVEDVGVPDSDFTAPQVIASTGTVTLYSDVALSTAVAGADGLPLAALPGQTTLPATFRAVIPSTVSLTYGTTYYLKYSLTCTNGVNTATRGDSIPVVASYATPRF